jgi:hypothetical protein
MNRATQYELHNSLLRCDFRNAALHSMMSTSKAEAKAPFAFGVGINEHGTALRCEPPAQSES